MKGIHSDSEGTANRRARLGNPGLVIGGRYQLTALIGRGGFSEVWEAQQIAGEAGEAQLSLQTVALKLMPLVAQRQALVAQFKEVLAVRDLRCDALVTVHDAGICTETNLAFIALQRLHGQTLAQRLKLGPVYWRRALMIARAIASALDICHDHGIIHADLKPDNIFLETPEPGQAAPIRVRILDFGIAHVRALIATDSVVELRAEFDNGGSEDATVVSDDCSSLSQSSDGKASNSGTRPRILGTPGYIPAECLLGAAPTRTADAFAFGVTLFRMIAGKAPQCLAEDENDTGEHSSRLSAKRLRGLLNAATLRGDLAQLKEVVPTVPDAVARWVNALLSTSPEDRLPADECLAGRAEQIWKAPYGPPDPPYVGLDAFGTSHAGYLFGRDADVENIVGVLSNNPFVTVLGPSGCGKSSLAHAGVAKRLDESFLDEVDGWVVHTVRPSTWPMQDAGQSADVQLTTDGRLGVLLVVDQLEEVLTLDEAQRAYVTAQIAALVHGRIDELHPHLRPSGCWRALLTIRDDMFGRVARLEELKRALERQIYLVRGVDPNAVNSLIRAPAAEHGFALEDLDSVVQEARELLSRDATALPLVQFALTRWWERRDTKSLQLRVRDWRALGGIEGALALYAQNIHDALDSAEQRQMRAIFLRLFTAEGTRRTMVEPPEEPGPLRRLLDRLLEGRLVRRIGDQVSHIEVAHEALARHQPVLGWLEQTRTERQLQQHLEYDAERWLHAGRPNDILWSGSRLKLARTLLGQDSASELSQSAADFLRRSIGARRHRIMWSASAGFALIAGTTGLGAALAYPLFRDLRATIGDLHKQRSSLSNEVSQVEEDKKQGEFDALLAKSNVMHLQMRATEQVMKNEKLKAAPLQRLGEACTSKDAARVTAAAIGVAAQLLAAKEYQKLGQALKEHRECIETRFQSHANLPESIPIDENSATMTIRHPSVQVPDDESLRSQWASMATSFVATWGIPVSDIQLKPDPSLPPNTFALDRGAEQERFEVTVPNPEGRGIISRLGLKSPLVEFFNQYSREFELVPSIENRGPWYLIPRWTFPVWESQGLPPGAPESAIAVVVAIKLLERPELLITPEVTAALVEHVKTNYPDTASEVVRVRGARLSEDLAELVKLGYPLKHGQMIFDALAQYPDAKSHDAARSAHEDITSDAPRVAAKMTGVRIGENPFDSKTLPSTRRWLAPIPEPVRIVVHPKHEGAFVQGTELEKDTVEELSQVRHRMHARFGVELPGSRFSLGESDELKGALARIEVLNQDPKEGLIVGVSRSPVQELTDDLELLAQGLRAYWVTPEFAQGRIELLPENTREWVRLHYSITDVKNLLRAVIYPSDIERFSLGSAKTVHDLPKPPPERTIDHSGWLLKSLVFWHEVYPNGSPVGLGNALQNLQRARLAMDAMNRPTSEVQTEVTRLVTDGVRQLEADKPALAQIGFGLAVSEDRKAAIQAFLASHTQSFSPTRLLTAWKERCEGWLSAEQVTDLELMLKSTPLPKPEYVNLLLCLESCQVAGPIARHRTLLELAAPENVQHIEPEERWRLGHALIEEHRSHLTDQRLLDGARRMLVSAMKASSEDKRAYNLVKLQRSCSEAGPTHPCWSVLIELARTSADAFVALNTAMGYLNWCKRRDCVDESEKLLDITEKRIERVKAVEERQRLSQWAALARGQLLAWRAGEGEGKAADAASKLLESTNASDRMVRTLALRDLAEIHYLNQQTIEARAILNRMRSDLTSEGCVPKDAQALSVLSGEFFLALTEGVPQAIAAAARRAKMDCAGDPGALFLDALAQVAFPDEGWERSALEFLKTSHDYVPYIAMMLSSRLTDPKVARNVIEQHWSKANEATWKVRAGAGDMRVWREMLIGYYLGKVEKKAIFEPLESVAAFDASPLAGLPFGREYLATEAHFYNAMLELSRHNEGQYRAELNRTISFNRRDFYEYQVARLLLAKPTKGSPMMASLRK